MYPGTQITNDNFDCSEAGVDPPNVIEQNYSHEWTNGLFDHVLPNGLAIADITDPFNSISEYSRGVAVDQHENSIVTGFMKGKFYDISTFEEVYETNGSTIFLQKKDPNGNILWSNYIDGGNYQIPSAGRISNDIAVDNQNNIFICGRINDTTDFDTGPGEFIVVPQTYFSGFVAKYSENGELDFVYLLDGGTDAEPRDIAVDHEGNILVAGIYEATIDFDAGVGIQQSSSNSSMDDNFLLKIDNSGQYIWHKTWGGQQPDDTEGLEIDDAGNSFVACQFTTPVDTDPGPGENILETGPASPGAGIISNSYVSKFDISGNLMWTAHFKSSHSNHLADLATDGENVCAVGINEGDLEIGQGNSMILVPDVSPSPDQNFFAVKLNASGEFLWNYSPQPFESPFYSYGAEVAEYNGEWFVRYKVSDPADLDNGPGVDSVSSPFTAQYIVKLSEEGMYQWNMKFEMDAHGFLELHEIQVTEENMYIVGHYSDASLDTNPDPEEIELQPSWFQNTMVLIKLSDQTACMTTTETLTESACENYISPSGLFEWTESGIYQDTLVNLEGCDSIVTVDLTIFQPSEGVDVQTACKEYTWIDGTTYTENNNSAMFTISQGTTNGCDSIVSLDLTINTVNTNTSLDGATITCEAEGATYQWLDCDNNMNIIPGENNQDYTAISKWKFRCRNYRKRMYRYNRLHGNKHSRCG